MRYLNSIKNPLRFIAGFGAGLTLGCQDIAPFGGEPGNVMIYGKSSGGLKTAALYAMPQTQSLFNKASMESSDPGGHDGFRRGRAGDGAVFGAAHQPLPRRQPAGTFMTPDASYPSDGISFLPFVTSPVYTADQVRRERDTYRL